ncbi:MAG: glucose 1-dehydrogenase [Anaerolineales bacterium]|jgi:NAD(P)-dependent dehydrogenase (short-subunit alcohol dehydrogenase family)
MVVPDDFKLQGKVALVTGASRGIGQAIAETFAASGAKVVLSSRKQAGLDAVAEGIRANGGVALPIAAHVGDEEAIAKLVSRAVESYGGIDILVNNAGTNPHFGPILTAEESHWQKTLEVNLLGYFRMVKACVESMKSRRGGKIINIASIAGIKPQMGMGVYGVTKAGVIMLTEVLAAELAEFNIQVNAIAPGFIKTKFSSVLWQTPQIYEAITKTIPQERMASPEEVAGIALYLASGVSSFTTGATFLVDGGQRVSQHLDL